MRKSEAFDLNNMAFFPWEKLLMSPEQERIMYRDWGFYFAQILKPEKGVQYYTQALELDPDDVQILQYRSMCKRSMAHIREALEDSLKAAEIDPKNARSYIEICDALYELNRFEDNLKELHDNTRKNYGKIVDQFKDRLIVVEENLKDSLGESLGPFLTENARTIDYVAAEYKRAAQIDNRPLWKILRSEGKCDVLSILEDEEERLSPLEIARRKRMFVVFNQLYYNRAWIDVLCLKNLRKNPNLLPPHSYDSTPKLRQLVNAKYETIKCFLKMRQARSPLYCEEYNRCRNKKVCQNAKEATLFRVQYQTHRNMMVALRVIRALRAAGKLTDLIHYVEEIMGDYVVLKTHRVMPWKFEFLNEVYNTLGLAYSDRYVIPESAFDPKIGPRLSLLLRYHNAEAKELGKFVFGDRSTYTEADAPDIPLINYKNKLARFEKRLYFAKYPIERSYLLHAISVAHFHNTRYEECCMAARKAVEEAKKCNSHLWQLIAQLSIVKGRTVVGKIESCRDALEVALNLAEALKNQRIYDFVKMCCKRNDEKIEQRKRVQTLDSVGIRKSKSGRSSYTSVSHFSEKSASRIME